MLKSAQSTARMRCVTTLSPDPMSAEPGPISEEMLALDDDALRAKLLGETARAPWPALARFFAQGVVLVASPEIDLIDVGMVLARDDAEQFRAWLAGGEVRLVSDDQAQAWQASTAELWTMVIKPWVLVQQPPVTVAVVE